MTTEELKQTLQRRIKQYKGADFSNADTIPSTAYLLGRHDGLVEVLGWMEKK